MTLMRGPNKSGQYEYSFDGINWTTDNEKVQKEFRDYLKRETTCHYCGQAKVSGRKTCPKCGGEYR